MSEHKQIAIVYHGGCPDGFGGAYAAWKKFGDTADYIPAKHQRPVPSGLQGKDLYFIDFCYPQEVMDTIVAQAASVTVLDHHEGVKDVATQFPGVFDSSHSGAVIAWHYFHPDVPVPLLLSYIEDGDLYKFVLPHSREVLAYIYLAPLSAFEHVEILEKEVASDTERERIITTGSHYVAFHRHVVTASIDHTDLVTFEGYTCYLTGSLGAFISDTGHELAMKQPPLAIIVSADASGLRVSLRGDGTIDVAALARKYGGNGHPNAAGFRLPYGDPIPWTVIPKQDENPVN